MQCHAAQELLSAYFDGELPPDVRGGVEYHVAGCAQCQPELESFRKLSDLAAALSPTDSPDVWNGVERSIEGEPIAAGRRRQTTRLAIRWGLVAAAALLVGLVIGSLLFQTPHSVPQAPVKEPLASRLDEYFSKFATDPKGTQTRLIADYSGRPITFDEAVRTLKYEPVANRGLPAGYRVTNMHVLDMPCCPCLLTTIEDERGRMLCVIEHDPHHAAVSSKLPSITTDCHGTETKIVQMDGQLAAVWLSGERSVTLVGPVEIDKIASLVGRLEHGLREGS